MILEIRRVSSLARSRGKGRRCFEFVILPFLVAAVIVASFLARSKPDAQGEAFLFFGTLYAFWCGLFGSCQAFNGEVASGEWSYWMLGMRRSPLKHYLAHFAVSSVSALMQVLASLLFLWLLWQLGIWIKPLGYLFIFHGEESSFMNQAVAMLKGGSAYNLEGLNAALNAINGRGNEPNTLWFCFCLRYYIAGSVAAIVAGVSVGLLISALCPAPQISLVMSVFLVVACTICSHTGIAGFGNDSSREREFAPVWLTWKQQGHEFEEATGNSISQTRWQDGGAIEHFSYLLPQRYFFNIARIPCLKLEASLGMDGLQRSWRNGDRLAAHTQKMTNHCKCPVCLGVVNVESRDLDGITAYFVIDPDGDEFPLERHWIGAGCASGNWKKKVLGDDVVSGGPGMFRRVVANNVGGMKSLFALCRKMAWGETLTLLLWCAFYALVAIVNIRRGRWFNELR